MSAHGGRRNKGHGEAHENHERWLLTYADMITLLVAFFIMLYAMSVTNQAKFVKLALSVRSGFGNGSTNTSILPSGAGESKVAKITPTYHVTPDDSPKTSGTGKGTSSGNGSALMAALTSDIENLIAKSKLGEHISIRSDERGIVVSVHADKYTFDSGSYELKPALKPILLQMADIIAKVPNIVRVEGHTDNLPIHNSIVSSNWDLSSMRASKVLTYLLENHAGFNPDRFSSNGYADTRPIAPNDTDAHRAQNRRVDIVILNDEQGQPLVPESSNRSSGASISSSVATPSSSGNSAWTPMSAAPASASAAPASVDITESVKPVTNTQGKLAPSEVKTERFKVEPFMPTISLKDSGN